LIHEHEVNIKGSKDIYKECSHAIKKKMCYNNVFNVLIYYGDKFRNNEWKVAYGYVDVIDGLMARHAFIVDENGKAIDPTLADRLEEGRDRKYVSFKIFDTLDEYLSTLEANDNEPALYDAFRTKEMKANEWASKKQLILIT
jgi:hypothetical protein